MKNLLIYVNPRKDFGDEEKITVKIQIDNSLDLGWKREDILLVTNFPYEYNGVKSLVVPDDNYCTFEPLSTKSYTIPNLFEQNLFEKGEIYWVHDLDVFQNEVITESEVEPEMAEICFTDRGRIPKWNMGSIFFKSSSKDIFNWLKDILCKYKTDEESAIWILTGHDAYLDEAETKLVKGYTESDIPGIKNINERVKKINISYNFRMWNIRSCYEMAVKPIRVVQFHPFEGAELDFFMYGKNKINTVLMPERLIKIFKKHGASKRRKLKRILFKKMKNLMIYRSPEKRFLGETEDLVKKQIDNSLELGWKKQDIILITNFNYKYNGIKSTVMGDSLFRDINVKAHKSNVIFYLLTEGVVKQTELWWYHDLDCFQVRPIDSSQIDLEGTTAGFMDDGAKKLDTRNFFFRTDSNKIFEWMRNRTCRLKSDEATAFMTLTTANYRNINSMYKRLNGKRLSKIFKR